MLNQSSIFEINSTWLRYIILYLYCYIGFPTIFKGIFASAIIRNIVLKLLLLFCFFKPFWFYLQENANLIKAVGNFSLCLDFLKKKIYSVNVFSFLYFGYISLKPSGPKISLMRMFSTAYSISLVYIGLFSVFISSCFSFG